uniref:Putative secreted protein n=1 Tax=Phlebotomus kandelakii TaxID=1109342 RepID=A0A6B2EA55_9DIPT
MFNWWILLIASLGRSTALNIERLRPERPSRPAAPKRSPKHIIIVHSPKYIVTLEHPLWIRAKKRPKGVTRAKELSECGSWITMEFICVATLLSSGPRNATLEPLLAILIIDVALLLVRQHLVRLSDLLEALLSGGRFVLVRMIFERQLPVRLLDLIIAGALRNAQDSVKVLSHCDSLSVYFTLLISLLIPS